MIMKKKVLLKKAIMFTLMAACATKIGVIAQAEDAVTSVPIIGPENIAISRKADKDGKVTIVCHKNISGNNVGRGIYSLAAIYDKDWVSSAKKSKSMKVNLGGRNLELQVFMRGEDSIEYPPSAVYVGNDRYMHIIDTENNGKLVITSPNENKDLVVASGIMVMLQARLDLDVETQISKITLPANSKEGKSIRGIHVCNGQLNVNGNLTISDVELKNEYRDYPDKLRQVYGIGVEGFGNATINKNLTIEKVKGSAMIVGGAVNTKIEAKGDVKITAYPDVEHEKWYRAAYIPDGEISINVQRIDDKNMVIGKSKVQIKGDISSQGVSNGIGRHSTYNCNGIFSMALVGKESFWTGAHTYNKLAKKSLAGENLKYDKGVFNLIITDDAVWTNERQSGLDPKFIKENTYNGSGITYLKGGESEATKGVIIQKDKNPIAIDD